MDNSNADELLEDIKTDSTYQPLLDEPIRMTSFCYAFPLQSQNRTFFDFEIERHFRLYRYVIYVYLFISTLQIVKSALEFIGTSESETLVPILTHIFSFAIWFIGHHSFLFRTAKWQFRFQGLLIFFMIYHVFTCSEIVLESYDVVPNLTYSSFGLNAVYGIIIPILVYYRGDELRLIFEVNNPKSAI